MTRAVSALLSLCFIVLAHAQEGSRKHVGKITEVKGEAYLEEEGESRRLTASDKGTLLFAEQKLRCGAKCRVDFYVGSTPEKIIDGETYLIPNVPARRPEGSRDRVTAGSETRGLNDILLAPPEKGVGFVRPESFKFRWLTSKSNISPLTISLNGCKTDDLVWSESNIDYQRGSYAPQRVIELLKQRQKPKSATELEVVVSSDSLTSKQRYCFEIIPASKEQLLRRELAEWDSYADSIRHTERAQIFYNYQLYGEAADEYDMALKLSPSMDYLLAGAIKTYYLLGDAERVKDLLNRLGGLSPRSQLYEELLWMTGRK